MVREMNVPKYTTVQVVSEEVSDLSDIIVELTVSTGRKNPYHIYFPKTDRSGVATLSREDFVGQFKDHWQSALMDHSGTPESADPVVRVTLYDPSWSIHNPALALAWPLLEHERTKWSSREEEYRSRVSSRGGDFIATPITVDLHETQDIVLRVMKKGVADTLP
jgi:hypothetical protein